MSVSRKRLLAHAAPPLAAAVLALALPAYAAAAPGDLDPSFSGDGKVTTDVDALVDPTGSSEDVANALAIDSSGRIVAAGYANGSDGDLWAIARYLSDGSLDKTFEVPPFCPGAHAQAVAIQSDGKIVVAGFAPTDCSSHRIAVARYDTDGQLDDTFGSDGVLLSGSDASEGYGLVIAADGTIVVAGWASVDHAGTVSKDFVIARFDDTGTPLGSTTVDFADKGDDLGRAVALDGDGNIVVAGSTATSNGTDFGLARFTSAGVLDDTFNPMGGVPGTVSTDFEGLDDGANGVAVQGGGRIVAAGFATPAGGQTKDFALAGYDSDGDLDGDFGDNGNGKVLTPFGALDDVANGVALYPDGKIVAAGYTDTGSSFDFALARYSPGGVLDSAFGTGGLVTTDFAGGNDEVNGVTLQGDGKIVVAGATAVDRAPPAARLRAVVGGPLADFALARYGVAPPAGGSPSTPTITPTTAAQLNPCADDGAGPNVSITSLQNTAVYGLGSKASVAVSASDPSGLSVDPSSASKSLSTSATGSRTISAEAVDNCGNRGTTTFSYRVVDRPSVLFRLAPCRATAARVRVRISAQVALRRAEGFIDGRRVVVRRFTGGRTARGLKVSTRGLKPGVHVVTVTALDRLGNTIRRSRSLTVCGAIKPKFTG